MRKILLLASAIAALSIVPAVQAQERTEGPGGAASGKTGGADKAAPSHAPGGAQNMTPGGEQNGRENGVQPRAEDQRIPAEGGKSRASTEENRNRQQSQSQEREEDKAGVQPRRPGQAAEEREKATQSQKGAAEGREQRAGGEGREERSGAQGAGEKASATQVTSEQRTRIRSSFKGANIREANDIDISHVGVGVSVPRTITEYWEPVPTEIVEIVPAWRPYRVVRIHDEILIIDPATFEIVYIM
jgi:hypothetical protein